MLAIKFEQDCYFCADETDQPQLRRKGRGWWLVPKGLLCSLCSRFARSMGVFMHLAMLLCSLCACFARSMSVSQNLADCSMVVGNNTPFVWPFLARD